MTGKRSSRTSTAQFCVAGMVWIRPTKTKLQYGIKTAFNGCCALENIVVEGDILQDINFSYSSKLTHDSLLSILRALVNNTEGAALTCTLGKENLAKLTDGEKALATEKGWTLA